MKYRAEIDGLRALAVLPVILYHAGFKLFGGGYVGVDVFFVISGYLITTIILTELEAGTFSLVNFYERRARRILPALFLVLFVCLPFSWMWLAPADMKLFSQGLIAVSTFVSNILFWRKSGYFGDMAELNPLIHTWSLAVEEQYYVLFPPFLMLAWKLGIRWTVGILAIVFLASIGCAQYFTYSQPTFNFFMLPTRGWEILIGAFIAFYYANHNIKKHNSTIEQAGGLIGLLLITYSIFSYSEQTPFPSVYALAPTLGAALIIIFANNKTAVGKLLGSKLFVAIGLISYSAYLCHQPMFAFARQRSLNEPSMYLMSILAVLSFTFAYLSWKYVERPFRNKHRISRNEVFSYGALGSVLFIGIGLAGYLTDGYSNNKRWSGIQKAIEAQHSRDIMATYCHQTKITSSLGPVVCVIGDKSVEPSGALWGDSMAESLLSGLNQELLLKGESFYAVISPGCIPLEGASHPRYKCSDDRHKQFVQEALSQSHIKNIVWFGSFRELTETDNENYLIDSAKSTPLLFENKFNQTLDKFVHAGKKVVIVGDTPRFPKPVAGFAIKSYKLGNGGLHDMEQTVSKQALLIETRNLTQILNKGKSNATVVDGYGVFCKDDLCSSHDENENLMFFDTIHLSNDGAQKLGRIIVDLLY